MTRAHRFARSMRRYGRQHTLVRYLGETNRDGTAVHEFDTPEPFAGIVRPDAGEHFEIGEHGRVDASDKLLRTLERPDGMNEADAIDNPLITHPPVQNDDRIIVRGDTFRAVEKQYGDVASIALFALTEDSRSTDSDTSDPGSDPDDGSGDGSGDEDYPWL